MSTNTSGSGPRILALVDRSLTDPEISAVREKVHKQLSALIRVDTRVVDSASWYREAFGRCGNWDSWIWETVTGRDYETRNPLFDGFVICQGPHVSRATAGIIELALRNNRAVLAWEDGSHMKAVVDVAENDPEDYSRGWQVYTKELGG